MKFRLWILTTACLAFSDFSYAQTIRGDKYLGVSGLPIYWLNDGNIQSYGFIARVYLGKYVTNHFSIGFQPFLANFNSTKTLGVNFYGRYNFGQKRSLLFIEASTGLGAIFYSNSTSTGSLYSVTLGPGFSYFVKGSLSIDLMFQYQNWWLINEVGKDHSFVPSIGVMFYLSSKSKAQD